MKRTLLSLAILAGASAHACDTVSITVLPFEPVTASKPYAALGFAGAVYATPVVTRDECTLTVGYTDVTLYVARELTGDACAVAHVTAHEEEHVRLYRAHLATLAARIAAGGDALTELHAVRAAHKALDATDNDNGRACRGRILKLIGV